MTDLSKGNGPVAGVSILCSPMIRPVETHYSAHNWINIQSLSLHHVAIDYDCYNQMKNLNSYCFPIKNTQVTAILHGFESLLALQCWIRMPSIFAFLEPKIAMHTRHTQPSLIFTCTKQATFQIQANAILPTFFLQFNSA